MATSTMTTESYTSERRIIRATTMVFMESRATILSGMVGPATSLPTMARAQIPVIMAAHAK